MFRRRADDDEGEPPRIVQLAVEKSHVDISGSCRVNDNVLGKIDAEEKDQVAIHYDGKSILCTLFADKMIDNDMIQIRADDMKKLKVEEGSKISLGSRKDMKRHIKLMKKTKKEEE